MYYLCFFLLLDEMKVFSIFFLDYRRRKKKPPERNLKKKAKTCFERLLSFFSFVQVDVFFRLHHAPHGLNFFSGTNLELIDSLGFSLVSQLNAMRR